MWWIPIYISCTFTVSVWCDLYICFLTHTRTRQASYYMFFFSSFCSLHLIFHCSIFFIDWLLRIAHTLASHLLRDFNLIADLCFFLYPQCVAPSLHSITTFGVCLIWFDGLTQLSKRVLFVGLLPPFSIFYVFSVSFSVSCCHKRKSNQNVKNNNWRC